MSFLWRALNGRKTLIALIGFALELAAHLADNPGLLDQLPESWRSAINGGLTVLLALGLLHGAEKRRIKALK